MKVYISTDHRGFELKNHMKDWLVEQGHEVIDCGNDHLDPVDDFVDFTFIAAKKLLADLKKNPQSNSLGIGICGSGIGVTIAANRLKGIRCGFCVNAWQSIHGRENDQINMLSLAADMLSPEEAEQITEAFLTSQPKPDEKYARRALKLDTEAETPLKE